MLNDIGQASYDRSGNPVVTINPARCRAVGPGVCEFVRAREYAHLHLGHIRNNTNLRQAEAEADAWAARNVSPASARAAMQYFNAGNGSSRIHGNGYQRARRVANSMQMGQAPRTRNRAQPVQGIQPMARRFRPQPNAFGGGYNQQQPRLLFRLRR